MNDKQALEAACALTGDSVSAVVSHRLTDTQIIFVVDRGIKGSPKFTFELDQLKQQQPDPDNEPDAPAPKKARSTRRRTTKK